MAVNWNWKQKMGELTLADPQGQKYKINLYQGNCLCVLIYDFKEEKTNKAMYTFYGFWGDTTHLKACLGLVGGKDNLYSHAKKIKLNTFYKDNLKIAESFAKANIKVELYYKEIK